MHGRTGGEDIFFEVDNFVIRTNFHWINLIVRLLWPLLKTALWENEWKTEHKNILHNTPGNPVSQTINTAAHYKKVVSILNFIPARELWSREFAFILDISIWHEDFPYYPEINRLSCQKTFQALCDLTS